MGNTGYDHQDHDDNDDNHHPGDCCRKEDRCCDASGSSGGS